MALTPRIEYLLQNAAGQHNGTELFELLNSEADVNDANQTVSGVKTFSTDPRTSVDVGAKNGTGVTVVENGNGAVHKTVLTLTAVSIATVDATTAGAHGALKVYDFPAGPIQILGCSFNLTTLAGAGGIGDTGALVGSLGTVTNDTANATLTSTEADLIASATGTLSGGAGVLIKHGSIVTTAFDGHTTPIDAFLNISVPDAGSSADDTVTVNGTITMTWVNLGDY